MAEPQEEQCELLVVGAGLAALHLVAKLHDSLAQKTVVVDASGGWLVDWSERLERLGAPHVRAPVTQHPHPSPLTLRTYAEKQGRQQELVPVVKGFAPVPTTALFRDFCRAKVVNKLPAALRAPLQDTVVCIEPAAGEEGAPGCHVHLASGRVLAARAAVYTPANRRPVLPAWARQLAEQPNEAASQPGEQPAPQLPARLPPGWATSDCVDLRSAELAGSRVAVVGGGMSAGLLAAGAAERGAHVTLICRRPLQPQPFETEVGWWGAKQLNGYHRLESAALRIQACRRARKQASVHLPVWRRLAQQAATGRLTVLEGWEVAAAEASQQQEGSSCQGEGSPTWQLTLKQRASETALPAAAAGPTTFQQAVAAASAAAAAAAPATPVQGSLAAADEAEASGPGGAPAAAREQPAELHVQAQLVWLACGAAYSAASEPVLAQLQRAAPVPLTGGYPWLDEENLCWPGAAAYVAGRGSMLSVGPCAGDLPGMRFAADRIAASLRRLDFSEAPVWEAAQQRLLARLRQLSPAAAAPGGSPASGDSQGGAGEAGLAEPQAVAAAVAAAAQAEPEVALEEEGLVYEEPRRKASVAKPDHLIDVSDLDPALPRRELQRYKFTDDDFEICVICQLDEAVPLDQVRTLFGAQHLEMWAVGQAAAYRLHLPRLYGRVIPQKCKAKKAKKVYLLLHKESDAEWRFLKG